jgi:hypothetical protein
MPNRKHDRCSNPATGRESRGEAVPHPSPAGRNAGRDVHGETTKLVAVHLWFSSEVALKPKLPTRRIRPFAQYFHSAFRSDLGRNLVSGRSRCKAMGHLEATALWFDPLRPHHPGRIRGGRHPALGKIPRPRRVPKRSHRGGFLSPYLWKSGELRDIDPRRAGGFRAFSAPPSPGHPSFLQAPVCLLLLYRRDRFRRSKRLDAKSETPATIRSKGERP